MAARTITWGELDRRADNLARWLLGAGVDRQDKVALYLYNCSEYLEATFACFKIGLVPVNTNYRYADDELVYLWENADAVVVVFHGAFVERIEGIRRPGPAGEGLAVGRRRDGGLSAVGRALPGGGRDHRCRRTAGGTTGSAPRGVAVPTTSTCSTPAGPPACPRASCGARTTSSPASTAPGSGATPTTGGPTTCGPSWPRSGPGMTLLPACPLMHGTGGFTSHRVPQRGRPGGHPHLPALRPDRAARHRRAGEGQRAGHRGRRLRQAHPGRPRRPPRPVGPEQPGRHHLVGGDVERGDQAGPAPPPPGHAAGGRLLLVRGHRHGQLGVVGELGRPHRPSSPWAPRCGSSTPTARTSSPVRAERRAGPGRPHPPRLLQGRGQDGGHLPDHRRRSATRCPATTPRSDADGSIHLLGRGRWSSTPAARRSIPKRSKR